MIGEGVKVRFVPTCLHNMHDDHAEVRRKTITGTIFLVNWEHRVFWVEYESGGTRQVEAFQFWDIGKTVKLCG